MSFLLSILVGIALVGLSVSRTIEVSKGNVWKTSWMTASHSVAYYVSINYIAKDRLLEYIGTCVGAQIVCLYLSWAENKKKTGV